MIFGEFDDDELRCTLRTHLASLRPVELVLPKQVDTLSLATRKLLRDTMPMARLSLVQALPAKGLLHQLRSTHAFAGKGSSTDAEGPLPKVLEVRNAGHCCTCVHHLFSCRILAKSITVCTL